jgi:hypothetical protein
MHGQVSEAWINNVGNNIGFCSGPVPFLTGLGVIGAAQGNGGLVLGKGGQLKRLRKTPGEIARSHAKIVQALQTADALADLPAPRTCKQWVRLFHRVVSIVRHAGKSQVVRLSGNARSETGTDTMHFKHVERFVCSVFFVCGHLQGKRVTTKC